MTGYRVEVLLHMPKNGIRKGGKNVRICLYHFHFPFVPFKGLVIQAQGSLVRDMARIRIVSDPIWIQKSAGCDEFRLQADASPMPTLPAQRVLDIFPMRDWHAHVTQ